MSFNISYSNPKRLLNIFEAVVPILEQGNIFFKPEYIELYGMDFAKIAYIYVNLDKDEFDVYTIKNDIHLGTKKYKECSWYGYTLL